MKMLHTLVVVLLVSFVWLIAWPAVAAPPGRSEPVEASTPVGPGPRGGRA